MAEAMASQSLYRKWRSQTFSDLVGQEEIVRTLKNALKNGNPAHAYLFTGPRGTGKTSTARLLAKTINCLCPKDGEPCNECQQCREIMAGTSFNVIEIDAASNRGIDSIRELRDKVMVPPATGKYKVYILDEAHMLTTEAFNALLKTLEEPPKHAIFVLATTEVHKMLPTVISRCQPFYFKRISTQRIVQHLEFVAAQEAVKLEQGAAELIARAAAGGMRDALSLLDQAIAYCGQEIGLEQVQAMLGVADPRAVQKFIAHVANLESAAGLHLIHELADSGADLRQINTQIADFWRSLMLAKAGADVAAIMDRTEDEVRGIRELMQYFTQDELTEYARIFALNDLMQKNQGSPQLALELALLSSIELHRRVNGGQSVNQVLSSSTPAVASVPATISPAPTQSRQEPTHQPTTNGSQPLRTVSPVAPVAPATPVTATPTPVPSVATDDALPDWEDMSTHDEDEAEEVATPGVSTAFASSSSSASAVPEKSDVKGFEDGEDEQEEELSLTVAQLREKWDSIKRRVRTYQKDGPMIAAVLNDYSVVSIEAGAPHPVVVMKPASKFHYSAMQKPERCQAVEWAIKLELNQECSVKILPFGQDGVNMRSVPLSGGPPVGNHSHPSVMQTREAARPAPTMPKRQPEHKQETASKTNGTEKALARKNSVRENTTTMSAAQQEVPQSRQERVTQRAKSDPVVLEVMRIFKAEVKDIQLK
jgi:DNA polymerase-3 subunit gamma/tau